MPVAVGWPEHREIGFAVAVVVCRNRFVLRVAELYFRQAGGALPYMPGSVRCPEHRMIAALCGVVKCEEASLDQESPNRAGRLRPAAGSGPAAPSAPTA